MISKEQEQKNKEKYGDKQFDVISDAYRLGKREGDVYAIHNAIKYLKRYVSKSSKANNVMDLDKAMDYISRTREVALNSQETKSEEVIDGK